MAGRTNSPGTYRPDRERAGITRIVGDFHLGTPDRADHIDHASNFRAFIADTVQAKKDGAEILSVWFTGDIIDRVGAKYLPLLLKGMDELLDVGIKPIYVYGNDEDQSDFGGRLARELSRREIPVFKNGQSNIAFIEQGEGTARREVATVVGLPLTLPSKEFKSLYKSFLDKKITAKQLAIFYIQTAVNKYKGQFENDLKTARAKDLPTYLLFHVPPFIQAHADIVELASTIRNPAIDILNNYQDIIAGGAFAHVPATVEDIQVGQIVIKNTTVERNFLRRGSLHAEEVIPTLREWRVRRRQFKAG